MAQQLSLKSRPRRFSDLIGQEKVTKKLRDYYAQNNDLPVALMFSGPSGTGKTSTARICSISLECTHSDEFGKPCNECYWAATDPHNYPSEEFSLDHTEINCAEHTLSDLKELLKGRVYAPANGARFRQYTIDELQDISSDRAQKFLLRMLEDSPATTKFYLGTMDDSQIHESIIDRCALYRFRALNSTEIPQLVEKQLKRLKSDLDPVLLAEVLDERRIGSARAIAQAVDQYAHGADPVDAVKLAGSEGLDTGRVCRGIVRGDWGKVSELLQDITPAQARECRRNAAKYFQSILIEEQSLTKRMQASKGIARLTQIVGLSDDVAVAAIIAGLHDVTATYAGA